MHYFKLLLIFVGLLMLTSPPVLAENWVEVVGADNEVYIDSDSILSDGNYLFYNIMVLWILIFRKDVCIWIMKKSQNF